MKIIITSLAIGNCIFMNDLKPHISRTLKIAYFGPYLVPLVPDEVPCTEGARENFEKYGHQEI